MPIKTFIKDNLSQIILMLMILLDELLVKIFCSLTLINSSLIYELIACLCICFLLSIFNKTIKNIVSFLILTIYTIYSFAQTIHYAFFKSFFSLMKLSMINELKDVSNEVLTKIEFKHLLFLLPIIIFIVFITLYKQEKDKISIKRKLIIATLAIFSLLLTKDALLNKYEVEDETTIDDITSDVYLYNNVNNNIRFYSKFGSFEYLIKDIERLDVEDMTLTMKDLYEISSFIKESKREKSDKQGIYEGKNLVLILCESFGPQAIKEDLTPTLYKLANEGTYFTNYYAPLYPSNTNDSEFISQTGQMPSIDYGSTYKEFSSNYYPYALANLFKNEGYSVNSYHSHTKQFYNRVTFHESFGFEYLYDKNDLGLTLDGKIYNNWIDDSLLFEKAIDNTDTTNKFFDFIITTSGHMPYYQGRKEIQDNFKIVRRLYPDIPEQEAYYYAAQMKLDEGIQVLLNKLEEKGVLEDTIIVLFGDHYPYGIKDKDALDSLYGNLENEYEIYKTPFIIYDSTTKGETKDTLASTFDIYPTITSLFNLDDSKAYTIGEDLFVEDDQRFVLFSDYSVLADNFYYDASSQNTSGNGTNNILIKAKNHYKYSQLILSSNYYQLFN